MTNKKSKILEAAISAAVTAGKILCDHANDVMHKAYDTKESLRDIVTPVERYAEQEIIAKLKHSLPHAAILTEESGIIRGKRQKTNYWVVDPLDGTVNYINHLPFYAVSIAFVENNKPRIVCLTILHEIAHLIAHHKCGLDIKPHGIEWKCEARKIGASGDRLANGIIMMPYKYEYYCPGCDKVVGGSYRKTKKQKLHKKCMARVISRKVRK